MGRVRNIWLLLALCLIFLSVDCASVPVRLSGKRAREIVSYIEGRDPGSVTILYRGTFTCDSDVSPLLLVYTREENTSYVRLFSPVGDPVAVLVQNASPGDAPPYKFSVRGRLGDYEGFFPRVLRLLGRDLPVHPIFSGLVPYYYDDVDLYRVKGGYLLEGGGLRAYLDTDFRIVKEDVEAGGISLRVAYEYGGPDDEVPLKLEISSRGCALRLAREKGGSPN